jgi:hypothetical protein
MIFLGFKGARVESRNMLRTFFIFSVLEPTYLIYKVRKAPSWPRSWANCSNLPCTPTGMHGPTCIFWANLPLFSLQIIDLYTDLPKYKLVWKPAVLGGAPQAGAGGSRVFFWTPLCIF